MIEQQILRTLHILRPPLQSELLEFAQFLLYKQQKQTLAGLWADLQPQDPITFEELKSLRQEMWSNFPRDPETMP